MTNMQCSKDPVYCQQGGLPRLAGRPLPPPLGAKDLNSLHSVPLRVPTHPYRPWPRMRQLFILSVLIILIGGGVALLWQYQQGSQSSRAVGDVSVVGPPTVAAATVDAILARMGSPMAGTGKVVEQ